MRSPGARRTLRISIHAPRTGSDRTRWIPCPATAYFNPRSPHGERRATLTLVWPGEAFQSTLPARGATRRKNAHAASQGISIHAPRTGSDGDSLPCSTHRSLISIHAPRTGSDAVMALAGKRGEISIHAPRTGSDTMWSEIISASGISIHAPRTGSDRMRTRVPSPNTISIHAPRTGSDKTADGKTVKKKGFQSTLPARGATL